MKLGPVLVAAVCLLAGARAIQLPDGWIPERPTSAPRTGLFADPRLDESSGVAVSRRTPGLLWTHNDSGNDPLLFATDTLGRALAAYTVTGATNVDWEAIRLGPCPRGTCIYLADTGDNRARRPSVTLYRFPEPAGAHPPAGRTGATAPAESLVVRYPDGAHDVEAMIVTPAGDVVLITKRFAVPVTYYRVPAAAWRTGQATAELLGRLPIDPAGALGRWVTDAALAGDGRHVAVRTYRDIFLFTLDVGGHLAPAERPALCDISGLEAQGEGIDWLDDRTLVLTGETVLGVQSGIHVVRCPSFVVRSPA